MRMRAKMEVVSLLSMYPKGCIKVIFSPVSGGSEENRRFFAATPNGRLEIDLSAAASQSIGISTAMLGQEFYLDLVPVLAQAEELPAPPTPPTPPAPSRIG